MSLIPPLNVKQRLAASLLASGLTRNQAAKELGIAPETLSRWRQNSDFQHHLNNLILKQEQESTQAMYALRLKAVERLSVLLDSKHQPTALRAIETVLARTEAEFAGSAIPDMADEFLAELSADLIRISREAKEQDTTAQR